MNLRKSLYATSTVKVCFNPIEGVEGDVDVIDLTFDVSGQTFIAHKNRDEVREALGEAKIVVADNPVLANSLKDLPDVLVTSMHYGHVDATRTSLKSDELVFGLLNHNGRYASSLAMGRPMLNKLGVPFTVYGHDVNNLDLESETTVIEDFELFAASIDILLVPAKPNLALSPTPIIALAGAGVAIVASMLPTYNLFHKTGGVYSPKSLKVSDWRKGIKLFKKRENLLTAREANKYFARRTNRLAFDVLEKIERRLNFQKM